MSNEILNNKEDAKLPEERRPYLSQVFIFLLRDYIDKEIKRKRRLTGMSMIGHYNP